MWKLANVVILGAALSWQAEPPAQLGADSGSGPQLAAASIFRVSLPRLTTPCGSWSF
jgi:hypothetical protein